YNPRRRNPATCLYCLGKSTAFKLIGAPQEGESADNINPSFKTGDNDRVIGENIGSTSKQDTPQPIAKRLRSAEKKKEVSEDPKQKKRKKVPPVQQPYMTQNAPPYSIVADLLATKANITLGQLMAMPHHRSEIRKALTPKRTRVVKMANHTAIEGNTPMTCKAQVAGWKVEVILDSGSSISIISKKFMESIGRRIEKVSGRKITGIHGERRPSLGIVTQVPIKMEEIVVAVDMEVIDATGYALILGTDWLRKAHAIIDYQECKLILKDGKQTAQISCKNTKAVVLDNDDKDDDSEEEYIESSDDSDTEDDEEVNFVGLTYELPYQETYMKYKITSEGLYKDSKLTTWEIYDELSYCFDPIKRKKGAQERRKTTGPRSYCWCDYYLETIQDTCEVCEEYQQDHKAISILPRKEVQD